MAAKTEIVKYIGERGISAAKKFFGNSKTTGVASLSDEQLGRGLNMFDKKKADKAGAKAAPKPKPKAKSKSPKRDVKSAATQKGLRFKDKPDVDIEAESDASRSVSQTNLDRGAASAGRSTNRSGKTNIGSKSIANFIQDQKAISPGMQARTREDRAYSKYIKAAPNKTEKSKRQAEYDTVKEKRRKADEKQQAKTGRKISQTNKGKKRERRSDYVNQDGEIIGNPTENQVKAAMRNAEARGAAAEGRVLGKYLKELQDKNAGRGQLESAGKRMIDTSDRMVQDAKKTLILLFGKIDGTKRFNDVLSGAKTKSEFLVKIRSMVNRGKAEGQKGSHRSGETGAVVGPRKSGLKLVDRSASKQKGRKEVTSRRAKSGDVESDAPMNKGGMVGRKRTGHIDYRKGGMVLKAAPAGNKGLAKLPTPVRNRMGYMARGGMPKKR